MKIVKPVGEHLQWLGKNSQDFETFTPLNPLKLYFGMLFALIKKAIGVNINSLRLLVAVQKILLRTIFSKSTSSHYIRKHIL